MSVLVFLLELFTISTIGYAFYVDQYTEQTLPQWFAIGVPVALIVGGFMLTFSVITTALSWVL